MRVPIYVHESNSIPGTANKINNLLSKTTFQTFPNTFSPSRKIIHCGNPIEESFSNITRPDVKYMHSKETLNILIFGGSQGASFLIRRSRPVFLNLAKSLKSNTFQATEIAP